MTATTASIRKSLIDAGLRPSVQRVAVMHFLHNHRTHPTAEEIHAGLSAAMPSLSLTTVYNTLRLLSAGGLVNQVSSNGSARFDSLLHPAHGHFLCRGCGRIFDVEPAPPAFSPANAPEGFRAETATLLYTGLCPMCAEAQSTNSDN